MWGRQTDILNQYTSSPNVVVGDVTIVIHHTAIHDKNGLYINSTLYKCLDLETSFNLITLTMLCDLKLCNSNPTEN